jgi:hypothetical protein
MRPIVSIHCEIAGLAFSGRLGASLLLALAAGAFVCGCQKSAADSAPGASAPAMPVQVQIAPAVKIPDTTEYLSILKSRHSASINPQVEGLITRIFVKSGDRVEAGTPLLQIDPLKQEATVNSQEASRAAQEANLRYAKISLERAQKLFDAGVISKQELDNAQTGYEAALAQVKAIDEQVRQQRVELHYYSARWRPRDGFDSAYYSGRAGRAGGVYLRSCRAREEPEARASRSNPGQQPNGHRYAHQLCFTAGRYRYANGFGESDIREWQSEAPHCTASERANYLGRSRRPRDSRAGGAAHQRPVLRVRRRQ